MKTRRIITGIVLVFCVSFMLGGCKGKTEANIEDYEKPVQTLCEAKQDGDFEQFIELFGPLKSIMQSLGAELEDSFNEMVNNYKSTCGDDYKFSYKIADKKDLDEQGLQEAEELLSTFGTAAKVTEGYELQVEVTVKGKKDTVKKDLNVSVGKIDNKWYIINFDPTLLQ